jgi:hypothetical protein
MTVIASDRAREFRPGDSAAVTGVYRATHLRHRMPHEITVLEAEVFPRCKKCGDKVKFELVHAAPRFKGDVDLLLGVCAAVTAASFVLLR